MTFVMAVPINPYSSHVYNEEVARTLALENQADDYDKFMKGGEAYEGTKKERLSCGNNLSTQYKQTGNQLIHAHCSMHA